jgi:hypothetical protein
MVKMLGRPFNTSAPHPAAAAAGAAAAAAATWTRRHGSHSTRAYYAAGLPPKHVCGSQHGAYRKSIFVDIAPPYSLSSNTSLFLVCAMWGKRGVGVM